MPKKRSDGEGSLHQLHAKDCERPVDRHGNSRCKCRWRGLIVVGWKPGKKPGTQLAVTRSVTAPTRAAAANRLRDLNVERNANTLPVGKVPTVEQWLNVYHARYLRDVKERTRLNYRAVIDQHIIPLIGHIRLDRLTSDDIEDAWTHLAEVGNPTLDNPRPLSTSTIHLAHVILRRALRVAIQKKRLAANPASPDAMDAPPAGDADVKPLGTEEWRKVKEQAERSGAGARWTVALAMGLRQGEALGLRWDDVDLDTRQLRVRQTLYRSPGRGLVFGEPKSKRSRRDITLPPRVASALREHRKEQNEARLLAGDQWHDSGLVFTMPDGKPIDPRLDRKRWAALLDAAGVPHVKLHAARHTAATILLLQGVETRVVMDIMGWSQVSTAHGYQHAVIDAREDAAAKIDAAYFGG